MQIFAFVFGLFTVLSFPSVTQADFREKKFDIEGIGKFFYFIRECPSGIRSSYLGNMDMHES